MYRNKRKCTYNQSLQNNFKMFKKTDKRDVHCPICKTTINLAIKGKPGMVQYLQTDSHKKNVGSAECFF